MGNFKKRIRAKLRIGGFDTDAQGVPLSLETMNKGDIVRRKDQKKEEGLFGTAKHVVD